MFLFIYYDTETVILSNVFDGVPVYLIKTHTLSCVALIVCPAALAKPNVNVPDELVNESKSLFTSIVSLNGLVELFADWEFNEPPYDVVPLTASNTVDADEPNITPTAILPVVVSSNVVKSADVFGFKSIVSVPLLLEAAVSN